MQTWARRTIGSTPRRAQLAPTAESGAAAEVALRSRPRPRLASSTHASSPVGLGPAITVEITTLSPSRPDALRYRLRCDKQDKVFLASATTEVTVTTVGGNGGYGIEKGNGDGSSGGDGGDGGDITVLIDPSVGSYLLTTASRGGKGGNPSKQANGSFAKGDRGRDGSEGSVDERREPVTIP